MAFQNHYHMKKWSINEQTTGEVIRLAPCQELVAGGFVLRCVWLPSSCSVLRGCVGYTGRYLCLLGTRPSPCPAKLGIGAAALEDRCGRISQRWRAAPTKMLFMETQRQSQRPFNPGNTLINDKRQNQLVFISCILTQQLFTTQLPGTRNCVDPGGKEWTEL